MDQEAQISASDMALLANFDKKAAPKKNESGGTTLADMIMAKMNG